MALLDFLIITTR